MQREKPECAVWVCAAHVRRMSEADIEQLIKVFRETETEKFKFSRCAHACPPLLMQLVLCSLLPDLHLPQLMVACS